MFAALESVIILVIIRDEPLLIQSLYGWHPAYQLDGDTVDSLAGYGLIYLWIYTVTCCTMWSCITAQSIHFYLFICLLIKRS